MTTATKMDPKIKADWVAALRSGEYEQGGGKLCRNDRHCCLGVLSELAVKAGVETKGVYGLDESVVAYGDECVVLPSTYVSTWAGLGREDISDISFASTDLTVDQVARVESDSPYPAATRYQLAPLNDGGLTFTEIADLIEEHL